MLTEHITDIADRGCSSPDRDDSNDGQLELEMEIIVK
jgi:hypothetical protein